MKLNTSSSIQYRYHRAKIQLQSMAQMANICTFSIRLNYKDNEHNPLFLKDFFNLFELTIELNTEVYHIFLICQIYTIVHQHVLLPIFVVFLIALSLFVAVIQGLLSGYQYVLTA